MSLCRDVKLEKYSKKEKEKVASKKNKMTSVKM